MGASKEKKVRAELRSEGPDKKSAAAAEKEKSDKKFRRTAIITVVVIVVLAAFAIVYNSNLFYTGTTAVEVDGTDYNAAEVSCFKRIAFENIYSNLSSQYGNYVSLFLDTSKPLDEQQYSEDQTWADYLSGATLDYMKQITALYNEAVKAGRTLTEDERTDIENELAMLQVTATTNNYSSADQLLALNYGKGVTTGVYRSVLERVALANAFANDTMDSYEYTDAELKAYYAEHADENDLFEYAVYFAANSDSAYDELEDDAKAEATHAAAEEIIAAAEDADSFDAAVKELDEDASTTRRITQGSGLPSYYAEWLQSADRKVGDTTVIDIDTGSYAVLYLNRDTGDYPHVSMRHILVNAEADEDGNITDEAKDAAHEEILGLFAEWQGDPTEDKFAELANANSDDGGSNTSGGLYENIYKGQMVEGIDEFLFDPATEAGDTTIVYNDGAYTGWHLVYFVGRDEVNYCDSLAKSQLTSEAFNSYLEELVNAASLSEKFGFKFVDFS